MIRNWKFFKPTRGMIVSDIHTYICVYMYQRCAATGHWLFLTEIVSVAASCFLLDGLRQPDLLSFRSN